MTDRTFLHGHLLIEVHAARNLPDMEGWMSKLVDKKDVTDPFVDVRIGTAKLVKTSVIDNSLDPVWNEDFRIEVIPYSIVEHRISTFIKLIYCRCVTLARR